MDTKTVLQSYWDGSQQPLEPREEVSAECVYGGAPVIHLKMAISDRHAHIHADKIDISR